MAVSQTALWLTVAVAAAVPTLAAVPNPVPVTVYHSHPPCAGPNVANRDTGDLMGEMYFLARSLAAPLECILNPPRRAQCGNHSCSNGEVLGNDLVVTQVQIEVSADALHAAEKDLDTYSHCDLYVADCHYDCTSATATFGSWNITNLMSKEPGCQELGPDSMVEEWWSANLQFLVTSVPNTGFWFSTLSSGENVTWEQRTTLSVSKNCSDNVHYSTVEQDGATCFQERGVMTGAHRNIKAPGWIDCYYATVLGPHANSSYDRSGGWTSQQLGAVLQDAFVKCPPVAV